MVVIVTEPATFGGTEGAVIMACSEEDKAAVNDKGHRVATDYHLNELFYQLSSVVENAPPEVDCNSNTGIDNQSFIISCAVG